MYTKEYFIKKFEAIPDDKIGTCGLAFGCAFAQCGVTLNGGTYAHTPESNALIELFGGDELSVIAVNDGYDKTLAGKTAKERILNKLNKI